MRNFHRVQTIECSSDREDIPWRREKIDSKGAPWKPRKECRSVPFYCQNGGFPGKHLSGAQYQRQALEWLSPRHRRSTSGEVDSRPEFDAECDRGKGR